ncbi:hypothetical protein MZO42_04945 [Sphingomonas psychrotolerans]|uniref:Uncharacterized protein n=1 Tax=Sphingomonas psychrotolerans TaxID=1327635 RepID=A0ABU3N1B4_9SPHN|nr:hypothetical protein [Sphingomonas psychrotolerans]MDT8758036.1 hypothetical protein [Sphingomonas psychrotolerans]
MTAIIFVMSIGLALYLNRRISNRSDTRGSLLSDNETGKRLKARIEDVDLSQPSGSRVASGNKVGGSADIEIKNSRL